MKSINTIGTISSTLLHPLQNSFSQSLSSTRSSKSTPANTENSERNIKKSNRNLYGKPHLFINTGNRPGMTNAKCVESMVKCFVVIIVPKYTIWLVSTWPKSPYINSSANLANNKLLQEISSKALPIPRKREKDEFRIAKKLDFNYFLCYNRVLLIN